MLQTSDQLYLISERFSGYTTNYVNRIINYVVNLTTKYSNSVSYLIDYARSIIDYVGNSRATLLNSKVPVAYITNYVNMINDCVEIKMFIGTILKGCHFFSPANTMYSLSSHFGVKVPPHFHPM